MINSLEMIKEVYYSGKTVHLKSDLPDYKWLEYRIVSSDLVDGLVAIKVWNFFGEIKYVPLDNIIFN